MPTVKAFIRTSSPKKDANVRFRYSDGRSIQLFHKSEILINPSAFDAKRECVKAKIIFDSEKRKKIDKEINDRKGLINYLCVGISDKKILTSAWLEESIDKELYPEKYIAMSHPLHRKSKCGIVAICNRMIFQSTATASNYSESARMVVSVPAKRNQGR